MGLSGILKSLLLPPGIMLWLLIAGLGLLAVIPALGAALVAASVLALYMSATPVGARWLAARLERAPPLDPHRMDQHDARAIVVLGGELRCPAPEYDSVSLAPSTLERVRYAAALHRITGLPVLATGGPPPGCPSSEAALMAAVLRDELGVDVCWCEERSRTTRQNAQLTAPLLHERGVGRVLLVTHVMHMTRAALAFRQAGLDVVCAPMGFTAGHLYQSGVAAWLPSATAQYLSAALVHEWIGCLGYRLTGRFARRLG